MLMYIYIDSYITYMGLAHDLQQVVNLKRWPLHPEAVHHTLAYGMARFSHEFRG